MTPAIRPHAGAVPKQPEKLRMPAPPGGQKIFLPLPGTPDKEAEQQMNNWGAATQLMLLGNEDLRKIHEEEDLTVVVATKIEGKILDAEGKPMFDKNYPQSVVFHAKGPLGGKTLSITPDVISGNDSIMQSVLSSLIGMIWLSELRAGRQPDIMTLQKLALERLVRMRKTYDDAVRIHGQKNFEVMVKETDRVIAEVKAKIAFYEKEFLDWEIEKRKRNSKKS